MDAMTEFYNKVSRDIKLQEKFTVIMTDAEKAGEEATKEKLIAFAKEAGYDLTLEEIRAFFKSLVEKGEGKLSDEELDQVAGGKRTEGTIYIALSIVTLGTHCAIMSALNGNYGHECEELFK